MERFLGGGAVWLQPGKINTNLTSGWGRWREAFWQEEKIQAPGRDVVCGTERERERQTG